jgi:hypothetical protein
VRIPYMPVPVPRPVPSLRGGRTRFRPVLAIRLTGPSDTTLRDGLADSGADDAVFPESLAHFLGVDLDQAEERQLILGGRPQPIRCRYAAVQLRITDGIRETYEWTAIVGFVAVRLSYSLLGHAGFLEYFDAEFRGSDRELLLSANRSFPGVRL